jgi:hypothetical protein
MKPRMQRKSFSLKTANVILAIVCFFLSGISAMATSSVSRVVVRDNVTRAHRSELVSRLRAITGLTDLRFDNDGSLRLDGNVSTSGSPSARVLLAQAMEGTNVIVLEDASSRSDVAFCRVVRGRWARDESAKPPAYVVLIDFTDFHQLSGDAEARAAFDVGWGLLHELDHVVTDSEDAKAAGAIGDCEDHINRMRLEVGLPTRADYFFTSAYLRADANFNSRYVRLSFERRDRLSSQTKRYWLVWDAAVVGGLHAEGQRALVR